MTASQRLAEVDPEIARLIREETRRQAEGLELIASENFVSPAVLEAVGSTLTNKYAEGYPGQRYYGGCEVVDQVEQLAIDRAKRLFGADHANVQPHSGSQANMAAYFAVAQPGDTLLAMSLNFGGHLTHGSPVNFSGRLFKIVPYGLRRSDETVDMDEWRASHASTSRRSWWSGRARTPACSASTSSRPSLARSAPPSSSTWPTSPGSWQPSCIRTRCHTRTSSPRPRTRRCAGHGAGSCWRNRRGPRSSTSRSSPGSRVDC